MDRHEINQELGTVFEWARWAEAHGHPHAADDLNRAATRLAELVTED